MTSWREKLRAYHTYVDHPALLRRYGVRAFMLLPLTTTETQRRNLMQATAEIIKQPADSYLFGLLKDIHPLTIGSAWKRIATIAQDRRSGNRHLVTTFTDAPHVFLE